MQIELLVLQEYQALNKDENLKEKKLKEANDNIETISKQIRLIEFSQDVIELENYKEC